MIKRRPTTRDYSTTVVELRGEEVTVEYRIAPAEPDVGFPDAFVDESVLYDAEGKPLAWAPTNEEERTIADACMEAARAEGEPDDPYDGTGWVGAWG